MKIMFLDFSTGLKTLADLETGPRRGLTNSLLYLPNALSKLNNKVYVLSDIESPGRTAAGVEWVNLRSGSPGEVDILVLNRGAGDGYPSVEAKYRVLWTHDLPHMGFAPDPGVFDAIAAVIFMSLYAKEVWTTFFPQIKAGAIIPNGADKKIFKPGEKDLDYLIYASHPIRGLRRVPFIFDCLRESFPDRDLKMKCFSSSYPGETLKDDHMDKYPGPEMQSVKGLEILPAVSVPQIAEELGRAGLMILPTGYPEICSNTILQSLASGTPIVTTGRLGSAPEWIQHQWNGALTHYQPCDYVVHFVEMCRLGRNILRDPGMHKRMIENAADTPHILTWEEVANRWQKLFLSF